MLDQEDAATDPSWMDVQIKHAMQEYLDYVYIELGIHTVSKDVLLQTMSRFVENEATIDHLKRQQMKHQSSSPFTTTPWIHYPNKALLDAFVRTVHHYMSHQTEEEWVYVPPTLSSSQPTSYGHRPLPSFTTMVVKKTTTTTSQEDAKLPPLRYSVETIQEMEKFLQICKLKYDVDKLARSEDPYERLLLQDTEGYMKLRDHALEYIKAEHRQKMEELDDDEHQGNDCKWIEYDDDFLTRSFEACVDHYNHSSPTEWKFIPPPEQPSSPTLPSGALLSFIPESNCECTELGFCFVPRLISHF